MTKNRFYYLLKNNLISCFLIIYFFLYIFLPPICIVSTIKILDLFSLSFIVLAYLISKKNLLDYNQFMPFLGFIPFIIYFYTILFISMFFLGLSEDIFFQSLRNMSSTIINLIIVLLFTNVILKYKLINFKKFIKIIIYVSLIEFICVLGAFISPEVKNYFNTLTQKYSKNEIIAKATLKENFRAFGFADNLFDSFGYRLSLIIILLFIVGLIDKKPRLIYFSLLMLFMPLINARTGLVLSFLGMSLATLYYILHGLKVNYKKVALILALMMVFSCIIYVNLSKRTQYYLEWGLKVTLTLLLEQKAEGVYSQILNKDLVLPDNYIIGVGGYPDFFGKNDLDNGYIKLLWYFGIIGIILYVSAFLYFWYYLCKKNNCHKMKCLAVCYFVVYFTYMIKLSPLFFTNANFLIFVMPLILQKENQNRLYLELSYS